MLTDREKEQIKRLEERYAEYEDKALTCKTRKTEEKYIALMDEIYNKIARICHEARKRGNV